MSARMLAICAVFAGLAFISGAGVVRDTGRPKIPEEVLKARRNSAYTLYEITLRVTPREKEKLGLWSLRWMEAERAMAKTQAERIAAVEAHVDRMKEMEKKTWRDVNAKMEYKDQGEIATYYRADAEVLLAKEKAR